MNPSLPLTNPSSFTFLHHQPLPPPPPPPPGPPPPESLSATLTTLRNLISLSHHTLATTSSSLSTLLSSSSKPNLISCPYNRHHRMPPQHLFKHSLTCPTPIENIDIHLNSLRYPHTPNFVPRSQSQHPQISISGEELCFSVADYFDCSNFFYRDCPGVVSSLSFDDYLGGDAKLMFTLPAVLSVECANLISSTNSSNDIAAIDCSEIKFLASDIWAIRSEVETWNDYPNVYSCVVLNALVLVSSMVSKEGDLKRWIIVNSPHYGVIIDESMREHIFLLFRLSLKAIVREAFGYTNRVKSTEGNEHMLKVNLKSMHFNCPVLVQALKWLASQFAILYGEATGRLFAINLFKQYLLGLDSSSLLISMEKREMESTMSLKFSTSSISDASDVIDAKLESSSERSRDHGLGEREKIQKEIFVYQVTAAVAALHERALLEEKIKASRLVQPFPRYKIVAEHAHVSKRAEEERQKRSDYRSIVEYDGIMQQTYNQETNKSKTREELLAEERDYKRRRMSYHGKKMKRTKLQVVRDIIDEYMEEIKSAGGIGCLLKGSEEGRIVSSEHFPIQYGAPDERKIHDSLDSYTELVQGCKKESHPVDIIKSSQFEDDQHKQNPHGYSEPPEDYTKADCTKKYSARNREGYKSHGRNNEQSNCRREHDDLKVDTRKHYKDTKVSSSTSKYKDTRSSSSRSRSIKDESYERKSNFKLETEDTHRKTAYRTHKSDSDKRNRDDDRYDPSESYDDVDSDSKYEYIQKMR